MKIQLFQVGLDIVDTQQRSRITATFESYVEMFRDQFTAQEIDFMKSGEYEAQRYLRFYINWSLKEAYVKAVGIGLAFQLRHIHFEYNLERDSLGSGLIKGNAVVYVCGLRANEWNFDFLSIDRRYVITIARAWFPSSQRESAESILLSSSYPTWDPLPGITRLDVERLKLGQSAEASHDICCCNRFTGCFR